MSTSVDFGALSTSVILGLSADYHDAAAALVVDGNVVCAAEEERFTRVKHDASLPVNAIAWCLEDAGIEAGAIDRIAFYDKPLTAYERYLATHARVGPAGARSLGRSLGSWSRSRLWAGYRIEKTLRHLGHPMAPLDFAEHHQSHAAAAFYPSPFDHAAVLTFDGVGEWATSSLSHGLGQRIELLAELRFPDSLGMLYSTVTAWCGFGVNDGEYKLMGLAPYGEPRFADMMLEHLVAVRGDGSFRMNQRWFAYRAGERMGARRLARLFDGPALPRGGEPGQREADLARSAQDVLETIVLRMARHAHERTGEASACLAGGVALNAVANQRLVEQGPFTDVWVQPAAGDSGSAVGAALWVWHQLMDRPRHATPGRDAMAGAFLGPSFEEDEIAAWLDAAGIPHVRHASIDEVADVVAERLAEGAIVGWFRGAMEFGPRALGHRSILADPRDGAVVERLNRRVKGREGFRPFAPAVLGDLAAEWFDVDRSLPFMVATANVKGFRRAPGDDPPDAPFAQRLAAVDSPIPACTHVDGTARVQTVDATRNPDFHRLLSAFHAITGCPVLLNTSLNRRDEPIARSPADALRCFTAAGLDLLVLENCTIEPLVACG